MNLIYPATGKPIPTEFIRLDLRNEDLRKISPMSWGNKRRNRIVFLRERGHDPLPLLGWEVLKRSGVERPEGYVCDHINGDGRDNRLRNLRFISRSQNRFNSKLNKNKRIGIPRNVYRSGDSKKRPFTAEITFCGKRFYLGRFETAEEAFAAYKAKATELFGSLPYSMKS